VREHGAHLLAVALGLGPVGCRLRPLFWCLCCRRARMHADMMSCCPQRPPSPPLCLSDLRPASMQGGTTVNTPIPTQGDEDGVGLQRSGWATSVRWPCWARTDGRVCALHCMGVGGGGGQSMLTGARSHRVAPWH
jgi:hypothetical protein